MRLDAQMRISIPADVRKEVNFIKGRYDVFLEKKDGLRLKLVPSNGSKKEGKFIGSRPMDEKGRFAMGCFAELFGDNYKERQYAVYSENNILYIEAI